jgi:hypothetical protein
MKKKAESDSEIEAVRVFFVKGVEYDSRTGLPWGVTQEQLDKKNADYQKNGEYSGITPDNVRAKADKRKEQRARAHVRKGTSL